MVDKERVKHGGRAPRLTESKVRMIRIMWRDNPEISIGQMALRFEISKAYCKRVIQGHVWPSLPIHPAHPHRELKVRGYGDTNVKRASVDNAMNCNTFK